MDKTQDIFYGGLIETMYGQFPEEEIPEEIKKYKEHVDSLFLSETINELDNQLKTFSKKERNYLNCKVLDNFFEIQASTNRLETAFQIITDEKFLEFYLKLIPKYSEYFVLAAKYGKINIVKKWFPKFENIGNPLKTEAIVQAITSGHLEVIDFLIKDEENIYKCFPMKIATHNGHFHVVKYFYDLYAINDHNNIASVDRVLSLYEAAINGHLDIIQFLVEKGIAVTGLDDYALRMAAKNGHLTVVKFLVEHGANVLAYGNVPLIGAAKHGHKEVMRYLIEHGADALVLKRLASNLLHSSININDFVET